MSRFVIPPKPATLKKYGITREEWIFILKRQGKVCAICGRLPRSGRMVVDHEHVKGWEDMAPEQRKKFVRGVLCRLCNGYKVRGMSLMTARTITTYLEAHLNRLNGVSA